MIIIISVIILNLLSSLITIVMEEKIYLSEMDIFGTYSQRKIPKNTPRSESQEIKKEIKKINAELHILILKIQDISNRLENLESD